jgi:hypothetical protein
VTGSSGAQDNNVVRTLWHGSPLSVYEELSLLSFVRCGHQVEVYTFDDLKVPPGVTLVDATTVLAPSQIFSYTEGPAAGSFAAFSNLFRAKLLYEKGGIYADADVLCLRPLHELPDATIGKVSENWLNGAVMKFPAAHPACEALYRQAEELGPKIYLGQTAELLTKMILVERSAASEVLPVSAFYPIPWRDTWKMLDPATAAECEEHVTSSYCVHWWNTAITMGVGMPKEALPPPGSFLHDHAVRVFETSSLPTWPLETAKVWLGNFRESQMYKEVVQSGRLAFAQDMEAVQGSLAWRAVRATWSMIDRTFPYGSGRRRVFDRVTGRLKQR